MVVREINQKFGDAVLVRKVLQDLRREEPEVNQESPMLARLLKVYWARLQRLPDRLLPLEVRLEPL